MRSTLLFLLLSMSCTIHAQKKAVFAIEVPEEKVASSLYNSIELLDLRKNTNDYGIVQKGGFNRRENVVVKTPLDEQIVATFSALIDQSAGNSKLLLLLRQLSFAEVTTATSEKGYFQVRAKLFVQDEAGYRELATVDTVMMVKGMDVTKKMMQLGSNALSDFIATNLNNVPAVNETFSLQQLYRNDSIEKAHIPLYSQPTYTDGLYYTYSSFSKQQPDETGVMIRFDKKDRIQNISYVNKKGETWDIENRFIYGIVYKGKPYVSGEFTCYPIEKRGDDFFFTGKVLDPKAGEIAAAQFYYGIMGALMASSATSIFELQIDHLSGGFIRIKEIK